MPEACLRILEKEVQQQKTAMKQAQPLGQKMDQARARFRRAVESGEKAMQALQKAQENFEQAQQEVMQAQTDLEMLMQEASLQVMPVPQVNVSLVRTLEALTGIIENLWNPDAGQPPEHLTHAIQESRQILQISSAIMSQEGGAALDAEFDAGQDPELWDLEEDEVEEMADFEEACSRWASGRSDGVEGTQGLDGEHTDYTAAEEDAHRGASGCGAGWSPVHAGPKVISASHDESRRHGTSGAVATRLWDHPSIGKFLRGSITILCIVACVGSGTHPERHWPACFDQTCGYPGEGPLTTLDSPEAPGMSLTPPQEFMTCDMIRRKTKGKRGPLMTCRACGEHSQTPPKWSEMQEMPCLGMQQHTCKRCRGCTMLPHVRRCFQ